MKIAMIGHKQVPSRSGGVEVAVENLAEQMVKKGHRVDVYNRSRRGFGKIKEYNGIRIRHVFTFPQKSLEAITAAFFATVRVVFCRYDVIHYHAEGPSLMVWLPRLLGKRTVVTIHGLDWTRAKWGKMASRMLLLGEKTAVKYADEIIVLSKSARDYFYRRYHRRTTVIPNGISKMPCKEPDLIKKKYGLDKEGYILFLARIVPEKGLHYLIKAFRELDTEKKLVIAGDWQHSQDYGEKVKKMSEGCSRIIFTGFVEGPLLYELFGNAALYVLPSEIEGMPISLLEAMSYGRCCLVSDIPENLEAAGGHAPSFKAKDTEDLKNKLAMLLERPEYCRQLGKEAESYVLETYSWPEIAERTLDVYENK